jgi:transcriptional regulator with XRE-family HTH domain
VNIDAASSPLAFFAAELKRLRGIAGITQEQLAEAINYAPSTVAAIETCRLIPSDTFAERADKVLNAGALLMRLQRLVEETSVVPWFRELPKVERSASEMRVYEPYQIPALLQTEDYTRAVALAYRPMLPDAAIDQAVALRATRQEILDQEETALVGHVMTVATPRLWAVMDESALHRAVGGPHIMRAQCEHLISLARRPNITIQVITNEQGATCAFGRGFEIIVSKAESLIYLEDIGSARYIRKTEEASQYVLVFDHLRASALDEEATIKLIKDAIP